MQNKQSLRIVVASDLYRPSRGGTETTTENIARGLEALGHHVLVVAPGTKLFATYMEEHEDPPILRVRSFPFPVGPKLRLSWRPYGPMARHLDRFKPDIIQVNNHYQLGKALMRYGRERGVPVVGGSHFMPESFLFNLRRRKDLYERLRMWGWRQEATVYNHATAVIGPTKTAVEYLTKAGLRIPTHVISNGIDLLANHPIKTTKQAMRTKLKLADKPTVAYIGRLSAEKELETLIEATAIASKTFDLQLVFVGAGLAEKELKALAAKLKVEDRVIFTGYLENPAQKIEYLAATDVFAIASPGGGLRKSRTPRSSSSHWI